MGRRDASSPCEGEDAGSEGRRISSRIAHRRSGNGSAACGMAGPDGFPEQKAPEQGAGRRGPSGGSASVESARAPARLSNSKCDDGPSWEPRRS
jgi:hypothetical protein